MKRLVAGILSAALLTSAAAAASTDPELSGVEPAAAAAQTAYADLEQLPAYAATMEVLLDGITVKPVGYNIKGNNYYKLRDIAALLSGKECQFNVTWDGERRAINLVSGQAYEVVGGELGEQPMAQQTAALTREPVYLDGDTAALTAYNVQGNNYFKLVDIGEMLGFQVGYDPQTRTVLINTPVTPAPKPDVPDEPVIPETPETPEPETPAAPETPAEPETPNCVDGVLKIWIDPGHGGSDAGNVSKAVAGFDAPWGVQYAAGDPISEKDFNLAVSQMLCEMLEEDGVEVRMTRTDDTTVTASTRQTLFSTEGGGYDMIFSVHHNAYQSTAPQGAEILIQIAYENGGRGREFGELLKQEYMDMGQSFRRFVFQHSSTNSANDYYFVLRSARAGGALAFISEFCFMTNPEDQLWLLSEENLRAEARAQYNAIMEYFETHEY
ncbi:N-acetylmuramoyl-L-alanine amidase [Butyricicoccus pullicaecorum]|nr:N-acetylmuramoyl-L-alanine amidase [Butyricicoccus pullicaecorum]